METLSYNDGKTLRTTTLFNLATGGSNIDFVRLVEVYNLDKSGTEWQVYFKQFEWEEEEYIGIVNTMLGTIRFEESGQLFLGITTGGLKLLTKWMDENQGEPE